MIRRRVRVAGGSARVEARDEELAAASVELLERLARGDAPRPGPIELAGAGAWWKGGPLAGSGARRHGLAERVLRRPTPRRSELRNLVWLAERLFQVPAPLAAATLWSAGLPRCELLVTERVEHATTLLELLSRAHGAERARVLAELARETARMHALAFVHRDLFPRNVLVGPAALGRRLYFLDCWRGGERLQLRGPAYDLACLFLHLDEVASRSEQADLFADYVRQRAVQGRPVDPARLWDRASRARRGLVRRLAREPRRLGGRPLPARELVLPDAAVRVDQPR